MTWITRTPHVEELQILASIYLSVRLRTMTWVDPSSLKIDDFAAYSEGEDILVAQGTDGEIAGFISVWAADDFIHMLYVHEGRQGRGAGSSLLQALPDWPNRPYRLKCLIRNTRARSFYQTHGFVVTGSGRSPEGEYDEMMVWTTMLRQGCVSNNSS